MLGILKVLRGHRRRYRPNFLEAHVNLHHCTLHTLPIAAFETLATAFSFTKHDVEIGAPAASFQFPLQLPSLVCTLGRSTNLLIWPPWPHPRPPRHHALCYAPAQDIAPTTVCSTKSELAAYPACAEESAEEGQAAHNCPGDSRLLDLAMAVHPERRP